MADIFRAMPEGLYRQYGRRWKWAGALPVSSRVYDPHRTIARPVRIHPDPKWVHGHLTQNRACWLAGAMRSKAAAFVTFWLDPTANAGEIAARSKAFSIESRPKSTRSRVSLITQRRASGTASDPAGFQKFLDRK